jgi:hypothetical protein
MNTKQFWNPHIQNKRMSYSNMNDWKNWLPSITSNLKKTHSNEKMNENEIIYKNIEKLENYLEDIHTSFKNVEENIKDIYFKRMYNLEQNNFYSESPNWKENNNIINMSDTLAWMSYNNHQKNELLDNDIDEFMNN